MCQASPLQRQIVRDVERKYKSAVFAGIVPDRRHLDSGGYHCCVEHLMRFGNGGDYSNRRKLDRPPAVSTAGRGFSAAIDVGIGRADMKRVHAGVRKVFLDRSDPRRKFINSVNCWDGSGDAVRYDMQANTATWASPDHQTHFHAEQPRAYTDPSHPLAAKAARAMSSVLTVESKAAWTAREEPPPAARPKPKPTTGKASLPTVPARSAPKPITHKVRAGDTLWALSKRYRVTVANLTVWNRLRNPGVLAVGQVLRLTAPPAPVKPVQHTVKKGDTLWGIGLRYAVPVARLRTLNGLRGDVIHPGRVLRLR